MAEQEYVATAIAPDKTRMTISTSPKLGTCMYEADVQLLEHPEYHNPAIMQGETVALIRISGNWITKSQFESQLRRGQIKVKKVI